jgi:hypothetical protein
VEEKKNNRTLNDYIEPDNSILDLFDIDTDLYDYMYDFQNLLNHEIRIFFYRTTRELEYFFLSREAGILFSRI